MDEAAENNIVAEGRWGKVICAVCNDGSMPALKFINRLKKETGTDWQRLSVLFQRMASEGKIWNNEQFKQVSDKIFEFKRYQIRIGCFQQGNTWVLTHGFVKKENRWKKTEIERAVRIMREHLEGSP